MEKQLRIPGINAMSALDQVTPVQITNYPWSREGGYTPVAEMALAYGDNAFYVRLIAYEKSVRAVQRTHNAAICEDSCLEFFFSPNPQETDAYFNFEINPFGTLHLAYGDGRNGRRPISEAAVPQFQIHTEIVEDRWIASYIIPFSFIAEYSDKKNFAAGDVIKGNFYKCGDKTANPHWGCYFPVGTENPDFHRPAYFGEIVLQ